MRHARLKIRQGEKRLRRRVGSGFLFAAGVGAMVLYGSLTRPESSAANAGQVVYEADARGHLRRVAAPTTSSVQTPPLWKPEPRLLLDDAATLHLRPDQRERLSALNTGWQREKADLARQLERAASAAGARMKTATPGPGASPALLAGSLSDYSALSERYDHERAAYWTQAVALLTPAQRGQADRLRPSAGRRK